MELRAEYESLLRDFKRQQAGIRSAEEGIGFSLADFSPADMPPLPHRYSCGLQLVSPHLQGRMASLRRELVGAIASSP